MDEDYGSKSWSGLVEELREIRRAIDAGTEIEIDGKKLKPSGTSINWTHARYQPTGGGV